MPKKVKGYNQEGESEWFIGSLPLGWSKRPPEKKEDDMSGIPETKEEPKKRGRPPMKDKE